MQRTEQIGEECRLTALGLQLRNAREAMGLSEQQAAERMFISVGYVRAMEEARYELMPAEVFARGYLRAYARLLQLDAEEVLRRYRPERVTPPPAVEVRETPGFEDAGGHWLERARGALAQVPDNVLLAAGGAAIGLVLLAIIGLAVSGGEEEAETAESAPAGAEVVAVNPELFKLVEDASQLKVSVPEAGGAATATSEALAKSLEIQFTDDCWVEVRDSSRRILIADMRRAGDREVVSGEPPYKVVLGKSEAVAIRYQGRWIDIEPESGKNHAQVVIGG